MANMSYCRFYNTLRDLKDCVDYIDESVSEMEHKARKELIKLCKSIAEDCYEGNLGEPFGDWNNEYEEED